MVRFFFDRSIFDWVIAIAVSLIGLLAILILHVYRYPQNSPPTITNRSTYNSASTHTDEN
ncbi:efflux RND transporter permease subunit, partial [Stenotrophomonas maltophilia]|uniref:efflux RND transporter permease subunit n=1 Tax=Stenotrophomonas maltophilia TaxID=40324 RepID=UPI00313A7AA4